MKTKVEKIETQVKMRLWGVRSVLTPMLLVIIILWTTGNIESLRNGNLWYVLIVGVFGAIMRISKIPVISILIVIALFVLNSFGSFHADEAMVTTIFFIIVGILYDHYLLKKEISSRIISASELQPYLVLMQTELETAIGNLSNDIKYYTKKLEKLETLLLSEQQALEKSMEYQGSTKDFEKSIHRTKIDIEKLKRKIAETKSTITALESTLIETHLKQKQ